MATLLALLLALLLGACSGQTAAGPGPAGPPERIVERIVALAPSAVEQLFALGLGDRLVGVSDFCDWPPEAAGLPSVGSYVNPSLEAVAGLRPDLVLAAFGTRRSSLDRLRALGIEVRVCDPHSVAEALCSFGQIARWCGSPGAEAEVVAALASRLDAVRSAVAGRPRRRVFLQLGPGDLFSAGAGSLQDDLIREAGGLNVAGQIHHPYPRLGLEQVLALAPEAVFIVTDDGAAFDREKRRWLALPLPAARTGAIYRLPNDPVQRPGPRLLDGLALMATLLHPECFEGGR
jgi:iron complex transport system substrate-binding protein